jgi:CBS domain containing-hemolysin-like protein
MELRSSKVFIILIFCFFLIGAAPSHHDSSAPTDLKTIVLLSITLVIFLTLTAFYAGSETALVSVNKVKINQLAKNGNKRAKLVKRLIESPEKMLGMTLVGTNLMHVITTEIGLLLVIAILGKFASISKIIEKLQLSNALIATLITALLVLIFAEILPKTIFRSKAERLTLRYAYFLRFSEAVLSLVVVGVTFITNIFMKTIVKSHQRESKDAQRDELRLLATMGEQSGLIERNQRRMIHSFLDLQQQTVERMMVPLVKIVAVPQNTDVETFMNIASESGFSRVPVYDGRIDNIIGIVNLLDVIYAEDDIQTIGSLIRRDVQFVPESKNMSILLKELQKSRNTMVFVVDEYGGIIGLVTVEDLVEEIVGEFADERDMDLNIRQIDSKTLECEGRTEIETMNELFLGLKIPSGNYETIAGYILSRTGTIPEKDTQIETNQLIISVEEVNRRSIQKVVIRQKFGNLLYRNV